MAQHFGVLYFNTMSHSAVHKLKLHVSLEALGTKALTDGSESRTSVAQFALAYAQPVFWNDFWGVTMAILFLDFDGVLHPEHCHESKHFSCLPVLEDAVRNVPEWQVVVSSTWRLQKPLDQLRSRFSADIAARVIADTPRFNTLLDVPASLVSYEREAECQAWLRANDMAYMPWLALDDRSWLFRPFCKSLLLVNGKTGLTAVAGEQLKERMRQLL